MVSELQVEDIWKNKRLRRTQDEDKMNFNSRWSRLLSYQDVMEVLSKVEIVRIYLKFLILIPFCK